MAASGGTMDAKTGAGLTPKCAQRAWFVQLNAASLKSSLDGLKLSGLPQALRPGLMPHRAEGSGDVRLVLRLVQTLSYRLRNTAHTNRNTV